MRKKLLIRGMALAFAQTAVWRDEVALWTAAAKNDLRNGFARLCRAQALGEAGRLSEAESDYHLALRTGLTRPLAAAALTNLSDLHLRRGDGEAALGWSERALLAAPGNREALFNKMRPLVLLNRRAEALTVLEDLETRYPTPEFWTEFRRRIKKR